jgi:hypothetical protein
VTAGRITACVRAGSDERIARGARHWIEAHGAVRGAPQPTRREARKQERHTPQGTTAKRYQARHGSTSQAPACDSRRYRSSFRRR